MCSMYYYQTEEDEDDSYKFPGVCARCGWWIDEHISFTLSIKQERTKNEGYKNTFNQCIDLGGYKVKRKDLREVAHASARRMFLEYVDPLSGNEEVQTLAKKIFEKNKDKWKKESEKK